MAQQFCMERTRFRFPYFFLGLLYLLVALALGVYGWSELQEDKTDWEFQDYGALAVGLGGAVLFAGGGVYTCYGALRDSLFPAKSQLAKSIRAQLPYPDEAPEVRELFAMVDQDLAENGRWFDRVAVGKEWVLGDQASYLPRIRVIFGQDETRVRHSGGRTQTTRVVNLYIMDDRRQVQITGLRNPNELQPLVDCIQLRAPDAQIRPYREYAEWNSKSDEEWEEALYEYRHRQAERESAPPAGTQGMVLTRQDGSVTSRIAPGDVRDLLRADGEFSLTPGIPLALGEITLSQLVCSVKGEEIQLKLFQPAAQGAPGMLVRQTSRMEAEEILRAWLRREAPDLRQWEAFQLHAARPVVPDRKAPEGSLSLQTPAGTHQSHWEFTMEDIDVAAEGLIDGSYQSVDLTLPGGYLWFRAEAGNASDGRFSVFATRADEETLRFFKCRCTHRQAAAWLKEYARGSFRPGGAGWEDYTRQALRKKS